MFVDFLIRLGTLTSFFICDEYALSDYMAKTQHVLQVFVASPSDVTEERRILEDVVNEFNLTWSNTQNVRLELVKWETHTHPGIGVDGQDVVNKQIGDDYDIFIGIMWGRYGSPTNRAESGTEEEFSRAYSRLSTFPNSVQIMFYFKDAGIPPSKMNVEQLTKINTFKDSLASKHGGLYHTFESTEEFRTKVRIHLRTLVQEWLSSSSRPLQEFQPKQTIVQRGSSSFDPLANLSAITDDADEGVIELSERVTDGMELTNEAVQEIAEAIQRVGEKFRQRTDELNSLLKNPSADKNAAKRISNKAAEDLESFVLRVSVQLPEFHKQHSIAMEAFGKIALMAEEPSDNDIESARNVLDQMRSYRQVIAESSGTLMSFRDSLSKLPKMTTAFNRARKRGAAVTDDLLAQLRVASNQAVDVEELLERLIANKD